MSLRLLHFAPRAATNRVDVVEQLSGRRFEHTVHDVTHQVLQSVQQILKCDEGTLGLDVSVSENTGLSMLVLVLQGRKHLK